jgi:hypothetical protein
LVAEDIHFPQLIKGMKQTGFNRPHRATQGGGNAFQRIIHVKTQVDDLLMFGRQCLDASPHEHRLLAQFDGLVRPGGVVGQIGLSLKCILIPPVGRDSRPETIFPEDIAVTVQQNRAKPGEKLAAPVVAVQTLPRFHQRILSQVFGQREIATQRDGLPQQPGSMDAANLTERLGVASPGLVKQTPRF